MPAMQALPLPRPEGYRQRWVSPSPELTAEARRHILELADTCSSLSEQMHLMARTVRASPPGVPGFAAPDPVTLVTCKPAFVELVRDFAAALTLLTAAVDELQENGEDWEQFIADSRLLKVLRAGVAGWEKHSRR
jgi:hypothetical protein